jgi:ferric-dicitrate binding protein FerR (iron transport regulator)
MTINNQELRPGEEDALQDLLREMAPGAQPAPEVRERIRRAVAAEWRAAVAQAAPSPELSLARRRWQRPAMALAAGLAVAAVALGVIQSSPPAAPATVARITRIGGPVEAGGTGNWQPVAAGQSLAAGQEVVTGPTGKAALALPRGVTLRLDTNTRIALAGIDRIHVERGAVYLDAGARPEPASSVQIDSPFGSTRHLGTQYEVRVTPDDMQVSVREGRVELATADTTPTVAQAGEQLLVSPAGAVERIALDKHDPRWNWIGDVTPPFSIEDRRLSEFLAWVCRETGRELEFASPQVQATAEGIILRGSVAGLSPDDALAAVMATTELAYSEDEGRLMISSSLQQATAR